MIALSPLVSWLVVLAVLFIAVVVYAAVVAGGRSDEWAARWNRRDGVIDFPSGTSLQEGGSFVRIFGGVYDHEARGDFDLPWGFDHDPVRDHDRCEICNALLRRAFDRLADLDLGPRDADELIAAIRAELES